MGNNEITRILSEAVFEFDYGALSDEARFALGNFIIDYYSACCAGIKINREFNRALISVICDNGGKAESSVILGSGVHNKLPAESAAFLNAAFAHGADMDDGNRKAMGHIGAHVISSVFALAEAAANNGNALCGKEVLEAVLVGYEVFARVAAAAQPGLVHRGFHSTSVAGGISCAAACAKLMRLSPEGIYNAVSLAAVQSSGLLLIAESGQSCKPINPANAARSGIFSARLAQKGITAPSHPFESEKGWLHAFTDGGDPERITQELFKGCAVCESYIKPYPSCRHTHCVIQAAIALRKKITEQKGSFCAENIRAVRVFIYPNAIAVAGQIRLPKASEDTKFSVHYALARTLECGEFGFSSLDVKNISPLTEKLISEIECIPDPSMENTELGIRGARVELIFDNGENYFEVVKLPKGDPSDPMSEKDLEEKLAACSEGIFSDAEQARLISNVRSLEAVEFVSVNGLLS